MYNETKINLEFKNKIKHCRNLPRLAVSGSDIMYLQPVNVASCSDMIYYIIRKAAKSKVVIYASSFFCRVFCGGCAASFATF